MHKRLRSNKFQNLLAASKSSKKDSSPSCDAEDNSQSFFKVIRDPSSPFLKMPKAFVDRLGGNIPEKVKLVTETGEHSWKMSLVKNGEDYLFANGWEKVIKDAQLSSKEFVIFRLIDHNTFQVTFYKENGCEKDTI